MKRIFSLLMALMVVFSISASVLASFKKVQSKKQAVKTELRHRSAPHKVVRTNPMPKVTPRMLATATSDFDAVQVEYYMSYSTEGAIDHYITLYNLATDYPMAAFDVYTSAVGSIEGTYSVAAGNLDLEYAGFYTSEEDEGTEITAASLTITKSGETYTFEGSLTAGGVEHPISITAAVEITDGDYPYEPAQQNDIVLNFDTMEIDTDWLADYGELDYYFYTAEENVLALAFYPTNTSIKSLPDGTYSFSDTDYDAFGTGYYYYGFPGGSYYATDEAYFYIVSGSVTVATEGNVTTITMNAVSAHGTKISFEYSYTKGATPTPQQGEGIVIVIADYQSDGGDGNFTSTEGVTVAVAANGGTAPTAKDGLNDFDLRLYAKNTLTITYAEGMEQIQFYISEKGLTRQAEITASTGSMSYDMTNKVVTWTGNATTVTFTVGDFNVYGTDGKTKAGQFDFTTIVINGEGGDTPTPPTPSGDVTITGLALVEAYYSEGYWDFDLYTSEEDYYPDVYFSCEEEATSKTSIVGTWSAYYAGYWKSETDSVEADYDNPVGSMTVTCVSQGIYNFVGSFVGQDGKTYSWTANNIEVYAYDYDNYEDITLTDGGTPTPPTPTGDEITIAQAEEIAAALNDNETTTKTYTIKGYVGTLYDSGDFFLVAEAGGRSNLEVYKPTVDKALTKGDYVQVVGKLQKYISKAGKTILEVVSATVTHIGDTPTPPTPVGTEVNVVKAEEIAAALGNNEQTAETYTVIGYAVKAYDPSNGTQDIWMSDTKGAKGNFMAKKTTSTDGTIYDDEYIAVTGKIEKNFYNDKTTLQIYKGTAKHLSPTALLEIMKNAKVKKMLKQGKVVILRGNKIFNLSGMQIME